MREKDEKEPSGELYCLSFHKSLDGSDEQIRREAAFPSWVGAACSNTTDPQECVLHEKGKKMYADCFQTQSRVVPVWKAGSSFYLPALFFLQALRRCGDTGRLSLTHPPHPSFFSSLARLYHPARCTLEAACTCA